MTIECVLFVISMVKFVIFKKIIFHGSAQEFLESFCFMLKTRSFTKILRIESFETS